VKRHMADALMLRLIRRRPPRKPSENPVAYVGYVLAEQLCSMSQEELRAVISTPIGEHPGVVQLLNEAMVQAANAYVKP
jgi:hypothetical protein